MYEDNSYLIDAVNLLIQIGEREYPLTDRDVLQYDQQIYLRRNLFSEVFNLDLKFNHRILSLSLSTQLDLPIYREMRQARLRENLLRLQGKSQMAHEVPRDYHLFSGAMMDWSGSISAYQQGGKEYNGRLDGGVELAGGELNGYYYYSRMIGRTYQDYSWYWRFVDNDRPWMRQASVGFLPSSPLATNPYILQGFKLTNAPSMYRKSFSNYIFNGYIEPNWLVELYINDFLVDLVKADGSGYYQFELPILYGSNLVRLRFYGPWGEERSYEKQITIPMTFLPPGEMEYSLSAGRMENLGDADYAQLRLRRGFGDVMTLGGGLDYLPIQQSDGYWPFVDANLRLSNDLIASVSYTLGVRSTASLSYAPRQTRGLGLTLDYILYDREQKTFPTQYRDEKKLSLFLPTRFLTIPIAYRIAFQQTTSSQLQFTTGEFGFTSHWRTLSANIFTRMNWLDEDLFLSRLFINTAMSLPGRLWLRPQIQYNLIQDRIETASLNLERRVFRNGYITGTVEHYPDAQMTNAYLSFTYNLPFSQLGSAYSVFDDRVRFTQSIRGTAGYSRPAKTLLLDNSRWVGRSGLALTPFIDINDDGSWQENEPKAGNMDIGINAGMIRYSERDSVVHVTSLEPHQNYYLDINATGLDNIFWQPKMRSFTVAVDPNQFKEIPIPVQVLNEVNGNVVLQTSAGIQPQSGIKIHIVAQGGRDDKTVRTDSDGFYSLTGPFTGHFQAWVDTLQLAKTELQCEPAMREFDILPTVEGDLVEHIDFTLKPVQQAVPAESAPLEEMITIRLQNVFFDFDKHTLRAASFPELNKLAQLLQEHREIEIELGGHADYFGSDQYNVVLSHHRAVEVQKYLVSKGVEENRVKTRWFGESKPAASNRTAAGRQQNRRVDFTILTVNTRIRQIIDSHPFIQERKAVHVYDAGGAKVDESDINTPTEQTIKETSPGEWQRDHEKFLSQYLEAIRACQMGNYETVVNSVRTLLKEFPGHDRGGNGTYWMGVAFYAQGQLQQAKEAFASVLSLDFSYKRESALFMLGHISFLLQDYDGASRFLKQMTEEYPQSKFFDTALRELQEIRDQGKSAAEK